MKWSVLSGCSALLALACSGTNGAPIGGGWYGPGEPGGSLAGSANATGGSVSFPGGGSGASTATGGSGTGAEAGSSSIPSGGCGAGTATATGGSGTGAEAGSSSIPNGGYGAGTATGGGTSIGGYGAGTATGGSTSIGGYGAGTATGGSGGVDPNSCSHDVARCFEAAAACYEYSPWSECDQIVDVCAAMEAQCNTAKASMGMGAAPG